MDIFSSASSAVFQSTPPGWEATWKVKKIITQKSKFQSTPPGWEATAKIYEEWSDSLEFLLNSPRGALDWRGVVAFIGERLPILSGFSGAKEAENS